MGLQLDYVTLLVLFLLNVGFPFLVDLVAKRFASTPLKTFLMLVLQLITGVIVGFGQAHTNHQVFDWSAAIQALVASIVFGAATVFKLHNLALIGANGLLAPALPGGVGQVDPVKVAASGVTVGAPVSPVQPV